MRKCGKNWFLFGLILGLAVWMQTPVISAEEDTGDTGDIGPTSPHQNHEILLYGNDDGDSGNDGDASGDPGPTGP